MNETAVSFLCRVPTHGQGTPGVGSVSADESPWTVCKHDEAWSGPETVSFFILFFKARCLFKVRTCAAPAADAAVLGLFSVKQTGLLAFKPALHSLHPPSRPREEIETIFRQIAPAFLIRPIIKGKKTNSHESLKPSCPLIVAKINN